MMSSQSHIKKTTTDAKTQKEAGVVSASEQSGDDDAESKGVEA